MNLEDLRIDGTILRFTDSYQEFANILLYRTTIAFSIFDVQIIKDPISGQKQSTE